MMFHPHTCRYLGDVVIVVVILTSNELNEHRWTCCCCRYMMMYDYFHYINVLFLLCFMCSSGDLWMSVHILSWLNKVNMWVIHFPTVAFSSYFRFVQNNSKIMLLYVHSPSYKNHTTHSLIGGIYNLTILTKHVKFSVGALNDNKHWRASKRYR